MNRFVIIFLTFWLLLLLEQTPALAAGSTLIDVTIANQVRSKLAADPMVKGGAIGVSESNGRRPTSQAQGKILQLRCRTASSQRVKHPIRALVFLAISVSFLPIVRGDVVPRPYPSGTPIPTKTPIPDSPTPKKPHRTPNGEDASLDLVAPGGALAGLSVGGAALGLVWLRRRYRA